MSLRLLSMTMEEKAQDYWKLSRQWRGDTRFGATCIGNILKEIADLAGSLNQLGWRNAEHRTAELLHKVINGKKRIKQKPNNVVQLHMRQALPDAIIEKDGKLYILEYKTSNQARG